MKPFLKWAGGKRWLFESKQFAFPPFSGRYIEPFLGGGAAFFESEAESALLGDANEKLIELYIVIRDQWEDLERLLIKHSVAHSTGYYYDLRSQQLFDPVERAAQFMYFNRVCWNGLYRENRSGQFNVPIGTKDTVILPNDDFEAWSNVLRGVSLCDQDFEVTIDAAGKGDFLFVDPPYTVRHNFNGFVKYNHKVFGWGDQVRLRSAVGRAVSRGAHVAMTNADHWSIRRLYSGFGRHTQLFRQSVIAGKAAYRAHSTELLITF